MPITPKVSELMISDAKVLRGALGSAIPAKTLALGAAWPAGWEELGLTSAALLIAYEPETADAEVQQALGAVDRAITKEVWRVETRLAQVLNAEVQNAATGGTGTTATIVAAAGVPGSQEFKHGGKRFMTKYMYGFEGQRIHEATGTLLPVRAVLYRATPMPGWELQFDKVKWAEGIAMPIGALEDITRTIGDRMYTYYVITDPATA